MVVFFQVASQDYKETSRETVIDSGLVYYSLDMPQGWKVTTRTIEGTGVYPPLIGVFQAMVSPKIIKARFFGEKGKGTIYIRGKPLIPIPFPFNYTSFSLNEGETVEGSIKAFMPLEGIEIYSFYRAETEEEASLQFREFQAVVTGLMIE